MNSKKGFREAKGDFLRAAAGAAVLIATTISMALWAGPAIAASESRAPSASSSQPEDQGPGRPDVLGADEYLHRP